MDLLSILQEFVSAYGVTILYTVLTAIASYVGLRVKAIYEEKVNTEKKEKVVKTVVTAVEQLYKDLDGASKLEKAKENIVALLNEKGLTITELEMEMLIESVCNGFKSPIK
jgi:predicted transcriptional regulator YheO